MQVLEQILQEIEDFKKQKFSAIHPMSIDKIGAWCCDKIAEIIRTHMEDDGHTQDSKCEWFEDSAGWRLMPANKQDVRSRMEDALGTNDGKSDLVNNTCKAGSEKKYIDIKDERLWDILFEEACVEGQQAYRIQERLMGICISHMEDDGWIPAEERLPEDGEYVLVWYEYFRYGNYNRMFQTCGIGYQYDGYWSGDVSGTKARCIAWQPLPAPYQPKEGRNEQRDII